MGSESKLTRRLSQKTCDQLKKEKLFRQRLLSDIASGSVFPALRNNEVDFYYAGGKLFSFKSEFQTHHKYAAVLDTGKTYLTESTLKSALPIRDFSKAYDAIKDNCESRAGVEASGVAALYAEHSYARNKHRSGPVLLDIEVQFPTESVKLKRDRVDLLLYIPKSRTLLFCEAKHYSNSEIWAKAGSRPKVVRQILRYQKKISSRTPEILEAYSSYVRHVNDIFGLDLALPLRVHPDVLLLIFGFDDDQKKGRLKRLLLEDGSLEGALTGTAGNTDIPCYAIGDISKVKLTSLVKQVHL